MYGSGVGALYVRQQDLGSGSLFKVWEKAGNQQNKWHKGSLTIKSSGGYKVNQIETGLTKKPCLF